MLFRSVSEPASEPVSEHVVEEPVSEHVVEEPVSEHVVEEPVSEPVVEEPVSEPVVEEPVSEPVVEEPVSEPAPVESIIPQKRLIGRLTRASVPIEENRDESLKETLPSKSDNQETLVENNDVKPIIPRRIIGRKSVEESPKTPENPQEIKRVINRPLRNVPLQSTEENVKEENVKEESHDEESAKQENTKEENSKEESGKEENAESTPTEPKSIIHRIISKPVQPEKSNIIRRIGPPVRESSETVQSLQKITETPVESGGTSIRQIGGPVRSVEPTVNSTVSSIEQNIPTVRRILNRSSEVPNQSVESSVVPNFSDKPNLQTREENLPSERKTISLKNLKPVASSSGSSASSSGSASSSADITIKTKYKLVLSDDEDDNVKSELPKRIYSKLDITSSINIKSTTNSENVVPLKVASIGALKKSTLRII